MQGLQDFASKHSGVPQERAFAVDKLEPSLYDRLGHQFFVDLSTKFYRRVYTDSEEWFRDIFATRKEEDAVQNNYEFFIQRFGGPSLYSTRKGHPALIARHAPFDVSPKAADRWLEHMRAALDELEGAGRITKEERQPLDDFLAHTVWFLVGGQIVRKQREEAAAKQSTD